MKQINKNTTTPNKVPVNNDMILGEVLTNSADSIAYMRQSKADGINTIDKVVEIYKGMIVHTVPIHIDRDNLVLDGKIQTHQLCVYAERDADGNDLNTVTSIWLGHALGWRLLDRVPVPVVPVP